MKTKYWLASMVNLIGTRRIQNLIKQFGSAEAIWHLSKEELMEQGRIEEPLSEALLKERSRRDWTCEYEAFKKQQMQLVTVEDANYPTRLRLLPDAPYALFVKGELPREETKTVAIVGARMCSEYGREIAGCMGKALAERQIGVISGMAKGIDSAGHFGALRGNGRTYAVLGCGVDVCYPPGNRILYEKIIENGGILSEYPPGTKPLPMHFPMRNRIISALGDALVVVEAKEKSGSLITADAALEQGKDVYAVPGRLGDVLSVGCNQLIKQGAGIILTPEDFLRDIGLDNPKNVIKKNFIKNSLEKEEMLLYSVLDLQPKNINEIINATGMEASKCIRLLTELEEKGHIRETFQNYYIRTLNV